MRTTPLNRLLPALLLSALLPISVAFSTYVPFAGSSLPTRGRQTPGIASVRSQSLHSRHESWSSCGPRMQTKPDGGNSDLSERATKVMKNMSEGEFGTRGELYVGLQFLMIFLVVLGPVFEDSLIEMGFGLGLLVCVAGIAFGGAAVLQLGDNLTPWPKPTNDNELQKEGVFGLCRHPIYGCLIITCGGLSLLSASYPRLLFTVLLYTILHIKANKEEEFLMEKHPEYTDYIKVVPQKFFPNPAKVPAFVSSLLQ